MSDISQAEQTNNMTDKISQHAKDAAYEFFTSEEWVTEEECAARIQCAIDAALAEAEIKAVRLCCSEASHAAGSVVVELETQIDKIKKQADEDHINIVRLKYTLVVRTHNL